MLHDFRQPVLTVTGTATIANKTIDQVLLKEFSQAKQAVCLVITLLFITKQNYLPR